jgi:hypothetical protein
VARLVISELTDLAAIVAASIGRTRQTMPEDGFLHAVLSFVPLTMRLATVDFLTTLAQRLPDDRRVLLRARLLTMFQAALEPPHERGYEAYEPVRLQVPHRHAAWSANLLILLATVGGQVAGRELFPTAGEPVTEWRRHALLWQSQLRTEGWTSLIDAVQLERVWREGRRDILVNLPPAGWSPLESIDLGWTFGDPPEDPSWKAIEGPYAGRADQLELESYFSCDMAGDIVAHALEPFSDQLLDVLDRHGRLSDGRFYSVAHALINLWVLSGLSADLPALTKAYDNCLDLTESPLYGHPGSRERVLAIVLRQLAADNGRLAETWRRGALSRLRPAIEEDGTLRSLARQAFYDLEDPYL